MLRIPAGWFPDHRNSSSLFLLARGCQAKMSKSVNTGEMFQPCIHDLKEVIAGPIFSKSRTLGPGNAFAGGKFLLRSGAAVCDFWSCLLDVSSDAAAVRGIFPSFEGRTIFPLHATDNLLA